MSRDEFIRMGGAWDTRHWIAVPSLSHESDAMQIERHLKQLAGLREVRVYTAPRKIRVTYDQTLLDYRQILEKLEWAGFPVSDSRWSRLKADWFQYLDTTARANAKASPPPCCSNPPGVNRGVKKPAAKRR